MARSLERLLMCNLGTSHLVEFVLNGYRSGISPLVEFAIEKSEAMENMTDEAIKVCLEVLETGSPAESWLVLRILSDIMGMVKPEKGIDHPVPCLQQPGNHRTSDLQTHPAPTL